MTHEQFRERFKASIGEEVFVRFIKAMHGLRKDALRLRFWQQDVWDSFRTTNPDCDCGFAELRDALRVCELHGLELRTCEVRVCRHEICIGSEYTQDYIARFPHARVDEIMVSPTYPGRTVSMWFCPQCDEIQASSRWRSG